LETIGYYLALPFLYLISLLPPFALYAFSDFVYFILYHIIGYRRRVVNENLCKSFPEKSETEIKKIRQQFYHYMCDLFLETFKTLTMSKRFSMKHCTFSEQSRQLFDDYFEKKKSIILVMGHFGNWEWAGNSFSITRRQQLYVIYHPLSNRHFNKLIVNMRTRFKTKLILMNDTFREMLRHRGEISVTAFIADQTPSPENAYWTTFLNQDTPIFRGTEIIAKKLNYPVVYGSVRRLKRGYYEIFTETLFENPASTTEGEISEAHTRKLETEIREQPEIWLWSHRRWKHKRPVNFS
jgi:KDO2-lipid IV(A) lauroyltransferase